MSEKAFDQGYYDRLYHEGDRTFEKPLTSAYQPLFRKVVDFARKEQLRSVLEVGCGSGVLAEMLITAGIEYCGFDFSPVAIEKARSRNSKGQFSVADATDPGSYPPDYDGIVCCEVLEHIEDDLKVIERWRNGCPCICSLPNFDYESHVRFFRSEEEIERRYGDLLDIRQIVRITSSPSANLTWSEYFRRIRWARNQPTRVLGIFGINRFSWYGGWFVFLASRR